MAGVATAVAVAMLAVAPAHAELAWLQSRVVIAPPAGADVGVGFFRAVNRGTTPVRITGVRSGCGCTAATLDRDSIPPGGTATVQATYTVGDRQGRQTVALKVETEEPAPRSYDLELEVDVKRFAVLTPEVRVWRVGEQVSSQVIHLALGSGFHLVGVESTTPEFSMEIARQTADAVDVKVTPRDLWAKRTGSLVFKVGRTGQPPITVLAMLRIE